MFSDVHQQYLTSMNLRMLEGVLDDAGIVDIDTSPDRERRMSFGRYLVDAFQEGVTSEAELAQGLAARIEALLAARIRDDKNPSEQADIAELENEATSPRRAARHREAREDMPDRTTETMITFRHPFELSPLLVPLAPGTYRVITDEDIIPGVAITAYRRSGTMLHIPAVGVLEKTEQYISVDPKELEAARLRDVEAT